MKHLFAILFFTFTILPCSGTGQPIDIIIWRGDTLITYNRLLETYPNWEFIQPKISAALERIDKQIHPEKYNNDEIEFSYYVAEWHVIDNRLFLCNIYLESNFEAKVDLQEIFQTDPDNGFLYANWVSDEIAYQIGKVIVSGINPIHEYELVLQISEGLVINHRGFTNYIAKKPWYDRSENPNTLNDLLYSKIDWARLPDYGNNGNMLGGLSGLAAIAGINVGEGAPTEIYNNLLYSESVLAPVIYNKYSTAEYRDPVDLIKYFEIEPKYVSNDSPDSLIRRDEFLQMIDKLNGSIVNSSVDRLTSILTISVRTEEPKLSA